MLEQAFLEVNFGKTYEVYNALRVPYPWKHYICQAEAVFWTPESCESTVSVVPVRFALLESLVLSSERICKAFWGDQAADLRNVRSTCFVERTT